MLLNKKGTQMAQTFVFKPGKKEARSFELLFQQFGGFSMFIRKSAEQNGYKPLASLKEVAKRTAKQNDLDYKDIGEGTLADGIE